ncbi:MAG: hypothetical protein QXE84_02545 [Candidatus Nitrosotenuis sp.]|uniref:Uncharacterized protein n=1 Tax=Candidatus Nitrosotenuis uzonensis TaxID=1407055 RepID=A0A812F0B8_9ARCH|nr:hypothetical protein [Candidatus Nitrosotenuis uzonensis]MCA2003762.1 hypothetical protein [Candidatus Nitrosotenuis sp.]CAE6495039.1 conserved hypothetical protein [Candidatus Nitrosotenuis uzonensis]
MKVQIVCQDKHEAIKLASLIFIKEGKETYITSILNTYDNELVISLKDHSAHSILLKDAGQADVFADFIQSVIEKSDQLLETRVNNDIVEITKG